MPHFILAHSFRLIFPIKTEEITATEPPAENICFQIDKNVRQITNSPSFNDWLTGYNKQAKDGTVELEEFKIVYFG